ncbi:MAG: 30S ribosomal protein S5 [Bacilli bacterium]|jgi:small subunit ribosomal protein S5|nr:30S ribosomal protein S5 [Bacilli bacterium]
MENEEKVVVEAEEANQEQAPVAETENKETNKRSDRRDHSKKFNSRRPVVKEYEERVVHIAKVTKVVKGGKRMKFSALVVVGNGKGKYGFGIGKSQEVPEAIKKAITVAENSVKIIPIAKNDSIRHTVEGEYGACKVFLKPAPAGTGLVAGGPVRAILELAGVKNVYSKVYGSRTSINVIKATVNALSQLKSATPKQLEEAAKAEEVASEKKGE